MNSVEILLKFLDDIEERSYRYQKLCQLRKSLFKPWPSSKKENTDKEDHSDKQKKNEESLTTAEQEDLTRMNKVLSKAQKTLEAQQKIQDLTKKSNPTILPHIKDLRKSNQESDETVNQDVQENMNESKDAGCNKAQSFSKMTSESRSSSASSLPKNKWTSENRSPHDNADMRKSSAVIPKSAVITQSRLNKLINQDSKSANARVKQSRVVPAHVKAPFKTNPSISVPKRQTYKKTQSATSQICRSQSEIQRNAKSSHDSVNCHIGKDDNRKSNSIARKRQEHISEPAPPKAKLSVDEDNDRGVDSRGECDKPVYQTTSSQSLSKVDMQNETNNSTTVQTLDSEQHQVEHTIITGDVRDSPERKEDRKFCLLTDGAKLNIPSKLRRYCASNSRLRRKVFTQKMTRKVDACSSHQQFLNRLEETFERTEAMIIGKKVKNMEIVYTNLLHLLNNTMLNHITESSSCYEILRAKKLLELLLTIFYQTEEDRLQTNIDVLKDVSPMHYHVKSVIEPEMDPTAIFWLPKSVTTDLRLEQMLSRCSAQQYYSRGEVEKYVSLMFQVQFLQLNISLLEVIAMEMLPLLRKSDPSHRDTVWILRSLYSILNCNETFPVIVKDTVQELEECLTENNRT